MKGASQAAAVAWLMVFGLASGAWAEEAPTPEQLEFFEKRVRPVLVEHCQKCHGSQVQKGGLRVDSRAALLAGGESGPAVVPGRPDEGFLVGAVEYGEVFQMPPTGKLPETVAADLRRWVEMGAPWLDDGGTVAAGDVSESAPADREPHWCFLPIAEVQPPAVRYEAWVRSPVDRFILARLEAAGLRPAPEADRRTWLRRVTFALAGLPPSAAELRAFLQDESPEAYGRVVDRLLASPDFGERWARHWLDLVRYAESRGHEFDYTIPNAWQYRDYVIRALNADVPYNQFVLEHVAGDLLPQPRVHPALGFNESVLGTGFWFLGEEVHSPVDIRADEMDRTDNKLDCFSKTFLALTVACARCHDHKFDPIATREYYALAGYVASAGYRQTAFEANLHNEQVLRDLAVLQEERGAALRAGLQAALRPTVLRLEPLLLAAAEMVGHRLSEQGESSGQEPSLDGSADSQSGEHASESGGERPGLLARLATRSSLPEETLACWARELERAVQDTGHPLHLLGLAAAADEARLDAAVAAAGKHGRACEPEIPAGARIVVDYRHGTPAEWYQEGVAFGWGTRMAGEIEVVVASGVPRLRVVAMGAAEARPELGRLELRPDSEREPSRIHWQQAGRTLKTPTVTLEKGRLFYLVRGGGYALAAVCGHRMLQGPLHNALVREWQASDGWQWIEHDLTNYVGQRVAVEFSPRAAEGDPAGIAPLAIALVIESAQPPTWRPPAPLGMADAGFARPVTLSAVAAWIQAAFTHAVFSEPGAAPAGEQATQAALLAWLAERPELWRALAGEAGGRLSTLVAETAARQAEILCRLRTVSATAPALFEGSGVDEYLLVRGNPRTPADPCPRGYLQALEPPAAPASGPLSRLELAYKLVDPANPLTSRVIVNRIWQHLFGRGLVASVDNFGTLGELPTHPELLDWLAARFMAEGWSIKRLVRELVLSSSYRMSSGPAQAADAENLLWHRMPLRRLEAEAIRDSLLAVSGRLDRRMGGPSVPVYLTPFMSGRGRPDHSGPLDGNGRRSIYLAVRRNFLNPLLLAFDAPAPMSTVGRRNVSNVPAQALALLNNAFVVQQAQQWADQALAQGVPAAELVRQLYETAFARAPDPEEQAAALEFVRVQAAAYGEAQARRAWADLCHVLFNAKEFVFVE